MEGGEEGGEGEGGGRQIAHRIIASFPGNKGSPKSYAWSRPGCLCWYLSVGVLHIVMGYCEGGDLCSRLKTFQGQLLPEVQVVEWFVQIALALQVGPPTHTIPMHTHTPHTIPMHTHTPHTIPMHTHTPHTIPMHTHMRTFTPSLDCVNYWPYLIFCSICTREISYTGT